MLREKLTGSRLRPSELNPASLVCSSAFQISHAFQCEIHGLPQAQQQSEDCTVCAQFECVRRFASDDLLQSAPNIYS